MVAPVTISVDEPPEQMGVEVTLKLVAGLTTIFLNSVELQPNEDVVCKIAT